MKKIYSLSLLTLLLTSCISEYVPEAVTGNSDILVVDGFITNDSTQIVLSSSVSIDQTLPESNGVAGAEMFVENSNGELFGPAEYKGNGKYVIRNGALDKALEYRLRISLDNEDYESDFLNPLTTPEIDTITYNKAGEGQPVDIYVSTHGDNDDSRYYKWRFDEIWEFHSALYANAAIVNGEIVKFQEFNPDGPVNEMYYCWSTASSSSLILETTGLLSENVVNNKKIYEISPNDNRLSVMYYIKVYQSAIRKSTYDYFENIKKNVEDAGSLFSPIPSEMVGNIKCVTNNDKSVIGYVDVTEETTKAIFIPWSKDLYEYESVDCEESAVQHAGYILFTYDEMTGGITYAYKTCIDCVAAGGTKAKPSFWPTSHK